MQEHSGSILLTSKPRGGGANIIPIAANREPYEKLKETGNHINK